MTQTRKTPLPGLTRKEEEDYLQYTIEVAEHNLDKTNKTIAELNNDIHVMLETYGAKDVEALAMWNNTVTQFEEQKQLLVRNEKARKRPYFGRINFLDNTQNQEEGFYIGRVGISNGPTNLVVIDWRAPIANAYYESSLGPCSYRVGQSDPIFIDLKLKRTYEIADDKLLDYYDSDVVANDELLTKYLAKNKKAVLGEIIATIQKEQNLIIRKSPLTNVIVQGVAGSGKTTVAMHRISYILYNYEKEFRPEDFYIIGSNHILLNYITSVLPDLDVYGIRQMTMEQLFVRLLYEDWDDSKYRISDSDKVVNKKTAIKGTLRWFQDLERFCKNLEAETIPQKNLYLNPKQFKEEFHDGKSGIYDRREKVSSLGTSDSVSRFSNKGAILLLSKEAIASYVDENPMTSMQNKILMLNKRLTVKLENEFTGKRLKYTAMEKRAIKSYFLNYFGPKVWKGSIFELYEEFLRLQSTKGFDVPIPKKSFDVYDLAALSYLYKRIKEIDTIREAHHIVIDEAQDFGMMAYASLNYCIRGCTYTIMGDVSQNIHFGYGLNDWEELRKLILTGTYDTFGVLKKSYRNTVEISNFAFDILQHGDFSVYPVEPIIRHGNPVRVQQCADEETLLNNALNTIKNWQQEGFETIAVVCRDSKNAVKVSRLLGNHIPLASSDLETTEFGNGVMVLPVSYTKGLEFDAVLLWNPTRSEYPDEDGHAKLLYVAATRALHELCVLHLGDLTGLIANPVPKGKKANPLFDVPESEERRKKKVVEKVAVKETAEVATKITAKETAAEKPTAQKAQQKQEVSKPGNSTDSKPSALKMSSANDTPINMKGPRSAAMPQTPSSLKTQLVPHQFGEFPDNSKLRPLGHSKIDLTIRWMEKKNDGLYLHSTYGTMRISPISASIIRITFARAQELSMLYHPAIAVLDTDLAWTSKDSKNSIAFQTNNIHLVIEKATGNLQFCDAGNQPLVAMSEKNAFQLEPSRELTWTTFAWQKNEVLTALGAGSKSRIDLKSTAKYISHGDKPSRLPLVFSNKGYGILPASGGAVIFCNIPTYGTYISTEGDSQIDYYFIAGKTETDIYQDYCYLLGK